MFGARSTSCRARKPALSDYPYYKLIRHFLHLLLLPHVCRVRSCEKMGDSPRSHESFQECGGTTRHSFTMVRAGEIDQWLYKNSFELSSAQSTSSNPARLLEALRIPSCAARLSSEVG